MSNSAAASNPVLFVFRDFLSGLVVFLVALPLCLGIALASDAPLFAGIISGIVGGLVVGSISGSHTSVSGPAAGLTAVVAAQIAALQSFEAFLTAVFIGGCIQVVLGIAKAGFLAAYFPTSVIKGLLAAIGVILILKQIPHLLGRDTDPEGEMAFHQPDHENTFSELLVTFSNIQEGAALIGILSLALLIAWNWNRWTSGSGVPGPLVVVLFGVAGTLVLRSVGGDWLIAQSHLVTVPQAKDLSGFLGLLSWPDFSVLTSSQVYVAGVTVAIVASLETLLNLEAVDRLDPEQRTSPPSRELLAQGVGNITCGLIGGLPVTSVIIRSSVNIASGNKSKLSTIIHGMLLLLCVAFIPQYLNLIPLSALAAILLVTGYKLANPKLFKQMWAGGMSQFVPFVVTIVAIVWTDLLIGILIGLGVSLAFILWNNFQRPLKMFREMRVGEEIYRIELANQVSFLNRATLSRALDNVPSGAHVLLDARMTDYVDPDIQDMLVDYESQTAPARDVRVSMLGFGELPRLRDRIHFAEHADSKIQQDLSPAGVLELLKEGNARFRRGDQIPYDVHRQREAVAAGQFPLATILGCIDSRAPSELIFDVGLGDIFSVRVAGNIARENMLGSVEYSCSIAGSRVLVVLGHTRCGVVSSAVELFLDRQKGGKETGCENIDSLLGEIQKSIDVSDTGFDPSDSLAFQELVDTVARNNVLSTVQFLHDHSLTLERMASQGDIAIVGAMYDVTTGSVYFYPETLPSESTT